MRYIGQPRRMRANRFRLPQGDARIANLGIGLLAAPLDPRITFTRASTGTYFDAAGVMQTAAVDAPRFDYDPVTLQPKGLLIEGARTNLLLWSRDYGNAVWGKTGATVDVDAAVYLDGTMTADKLTEDMSTGTHSAAQTISSFAATTAYTYSKWIKPAGRTRARLQFPGAAFGGTALVANFNLSTGTVISNSAGVSASIVPAGFGWYRCIITATSDADGSGSDNISVIAIDDLDASSYTGDGVSGLYLGDAQLEVMAFASSIIPTTTAAVTRAADVARMTGTNFSSWFNASEGTFVIEASYNAATVAGRRAYSADDGTASNQMRCIEGLRVINGGVTQANLADTVLMDGQIFKSAGAYKLNDLAASVNGGAVATDVVGTIPVVDRLILGAGSTFAPLVTYIRRLDYYNTRLPNSELQRLTA